MTAGIEKYKSLIKKKKKNNNKAILLPKVKLHSMKVLISKDLIDAYISHDEFVLVNNGFTEYGDIKEEIKNLKT